MVIGVLKEPSSETRVSLLPDAIATLKKRGVTVLVEDGAGEKAFSNNDDYTKAGAEIKSSDEVLQSSDVILSIHPPSSITSGKVFIGVYQPLFNPSLMAEWAKNGASVFSLDMLPRSKRELSRDVLSSKGNIGG